MKTWKITLVLLGLSCGLAQAAEEAEYLWLPQPHIQTSFQAQLGFGLLGTNGVTGSRGTPFLGFFKTSYALDPKLGLSLALPVAGTLSGGNDDFGVGNVVIGIQQNFEGEPWKLGVGGEVALPTAGAGSVIGLSTRKLTHFVQDQVAFSPYVTASYLKERLTLSFDFGADFQVFTEESVARDRFEMILFYDAGVALAAFGDFWTTVEVGGYSTLTYGNNTTALFAGPGLRFQEQDLSMGVHLMAPFRRPARTNIAFAALFDFRMTY